MTAHFDFDPADMEAAGKALYGDQWQSNLARSLGVDPRRVRQWLAGERKPQLGVMQDIIELLEVNKAEIALVARRMRRKYEVAEQ